MKKLFKNYVIIWAIGFVVFNAIVFSVPRFFAGFDKFGGAFWAGYIFIILAFLGQLAASWFFFQEENKDKVFLNMPLMLLSRRCLIVSLVFGTLFMAIPNLPNFVGAIIALLILAFYAITVIKAQTAAEVVHDIDKKIKVQTSFIKFLTVDAEGLVNRADTDEAKAAAEKVYEAVRYSDPMSAPELAAAEAQITTHFRAFSDAVVAGDDNCAQLADEVIALVNDRNSKCKILK